MFLLNLKGDIHNNFYNIETQIIGLKDSLTVQIFRILFITY